MTQDDRMETITDPAAIRACDDPDERGDFPCCTTPAPASGVGLDLDAVEAEFLRQCGGCDAGLMVGCTCSQRDFRPTMLALVAEVRYWQATAWARLEDFAAAEAEVVTLRAQVKGLHEELLRGDPDVVTLRARLAAVEALADQWADRKRSDGMSGNAWIGLTLSGVAADLRAALATTGEGQ